MSEQQSQRQTDYVRACASGLNLMAYDADPGARQVTVGGPDEARIIDRRDYLIHLYAQGLLLEVDADRFAAIMEEAAGTRTADKPRQRRSVTTSAPARSWSNLPRQPLT